MRRMIQRACDSGGDPRGLAAFILGKFLPLALTFQQVVGTLLGVATAAALLQYPYRERAGVLELVLALAAFAGE